jgi:hypothetical protein
MSTMSLYQLKEEYDKRDDLYCELIIILKRAGRLDLLPQVNSRMDRCAGEKVKRFNAFAERLIKRYSSKARN